MKLEFVKMHGLGNDFMVLDLRGRRIRGLADIVKRLSNRRFGIGFDQALLLKDSKKADFCMEIYNADGSRVEMCGNGIRCVANYIWKRGLKRKPSLSIETLAGIKVVERIKGGLVRADMGKPVLEGSLIPVRKKGHVKDYPLKAGGKRFEVSCVSMGNPHCVILVDSTDDFDVARFGPLLETHRFFPRRTNVEFVEVINKKRIRMRVWERGSGETLACGTGACASAVATHIKGLTQRKVVVYLKGGELLIEWSRDDNHVYMTGPAEEVFEGTIDVKSRR